MTIFNLIIIVAAFAFGCIVGQGHLNRCSIILPRSRWE
jgi:hypothetical protein